MRACDCVCSILRRQTALAVMLFSCFVPAVDAQQSASLEGLAGTKCLAASSERGPRANPTGCNLATVATLANASDPYEQNQLGIASALVLGPGRTIRDARKWFEKSAQQGYVPAQVNLGVLYAYGWGTPQNYGAALYWLKAAANQGSARAETNLGILYLKGQGVKQDYVEALRYFRGQWSISAS